MKRRHKSKSGQTAIELAMTLFIFIGMLAITYNAVLAFSVHQYVAYAAFMSARAMQASHADRGQQERSAHFALRNYIPLYDPNSGKADYLLDHTGRAVLARDIFVSVISGKSPETGLPQEAARGVKIRFKVPFVRLPLGNEMRGALEYLNMEVVSYLGREVSVEECRKYFEEFYKAFAGNHSGDHNSQGMEDGGC